MGCIQFLFHFLTGYIKDFLITFSSSIALSVPFTFCFMTYILHTKMCYAFQTQNIKFNPIKYFTKTVKISC